VKDDQRFFTIQDRCYNASGTVSIALSNYDDDDNDVSLSRKFKSTKREKVTS
jgi:hypothetical protein